MNSSKITLNSCYTPGVYAATKAGLEAGSDALRVELASEEVSLLLICYKVSLCSRDRILSDPSSPAWPRLHNRAHSSCQQVFHVIHLCTLFILCCNPFSVFSCQCILNLKGRDSTTRPWVQIWEARGIWRISRSSRTFSPTVSPNQGWRSLSYTVYTGITGQLALYQ